MDEGGVWSAGQKEETRVYIVTVVRLTAFIQIALAPSLCDIGRAA